MANNEETWQGLSTETQHALTHRHTEPLPDAARDELMGTGLMIAVEWTVKGEPDQFSLHDDFAEWVDEHHPAE